MDDHRGARSPVVFRILSSSVMGAEMGTSECVTISSESLLFACRLFFDAHS